MARPTTISGDLILAAARHVFLAHGIRGTTAEVAERAGVSEGSIFKRWKTKDELFRAAMQADAVDGVSFLAGLPERVGKGDLREQLIEVGVLAAHFFEKIVALHMHAFSAGSGDKRQTFEGPGEPPPMVARKRLASYFEAERRLGRIRNVDTDVLGRVFLGSIYNFVALELMLREQDPHPMPVSTYVRGLVDLLLEGALPPGAPPRPLRKPRSTR